ncbi:MAG TPA: hypothetical protein VM842_05335 [Nitrospira sp.]|jgi:hypothetical protein|nr:hypothetical protein [Nitrospira sp.]
MTIPSTSDGAQYRITFFFGPEVAHDSPYHMRCVFNVKKRSWKGGVQVAIELAQDRLLRARERMGYAAWLQRLLRQVALEDRETLTRRADDLFIQVVCSCALNLALHAGLEQENQVIDAEDFGPVLDRLIDEQPEQLMEQIRLELDLEN